LITTCDRPPGQPSISMSGGLADRGRDRNQYLLQIEGERESAPLGARLIHRNLLEAAHQLGGAFEIGENQTACVECQRAVADQRRFQNLAALQRREKRFCAVGQGRCRRQRVADRRVDFVCNARHELADGGEFARRLDLQAARMLGKHAAIAAFSARSGDRRRDHAHGARFSARLAERQDRVDAIAPLGERGSNVGRRRTGRAQKCCDVDARFGRLAILETRRQRTGKSNQTRLRIAFPNEGAEQSRKLFKLPIHLFRWLARHNARRANHRKRFELAQVAQADSQQESERRRYAATASANRPKSDASTAAAAGSWL
jgi:hypothetical protein